MQSCLPLGPGGEPVFTQAQCARLAQLSASLYLSWGPLTAQAVASSFACSAIYGQ